MKKRKIDVLKDKITALEIKRDNALSDANKLSKEIENLKKEREGLELEELRSFMREKKLTIDKALAILNDANKPKETE